VIGYTAKGGSGVEKLENYQLIHSDLTLPEKAAYDDRNELYPGNDIYTSLDVKLQKACLNALGNHNGAVIVSEAETGRILAMVSNPDFDPECRQHRRRSDGQPCLSGAVRAGIDIQDF